MSFLRIALLIAGIAFGASASGFEPNHVVVSTSTIEYAFTPGNDAAGLIVRTIDGASSQVLVQAFSFTHRAIAEALIRAHRRGLDVQVVADRDQTDSFESSAIQALVDAGVPVFTDADHAAAHNKVIVIDPNANKPVLVTGSFNFTFAAQYRNAENVLVVRGNPDLTRAFFGNWQQHRDHSEALGRSGR